MPTVLVSRTHAPQAKLNLDVAPLVVALFLALLFALSIWAAVSPHPLPDTATASVQGGL